MSLIKAVGGKISDTVARIMRLDAASHALIIITHAHHHIHSEEMFRFWAYDADLDDTETLEFLLTTPNTAEWGHFEWEVKGAVTTLVEFFEDCTHTANVAQTIFNADRNSSDPSTITIATHNDDGADGTLFDGDSFGISTGFGGAAISGGGEGRGGHEWLLKQNTKYLIRITSGADNNNVSLKLAWYEHTNKD